MYLESNLSQRYPTPCNKPVMGKSKTHMFSVQQCRKAHGPTNSSRRDDIPCHMCGMWYNNLLPVVGELCRASSVCSRLTQTLRALQPSRKQQVISPFLPSCGAHIHQLEAHLCRALCGTGCIGVRPLQLLPSRSMPRRFRTCRTASASSATIVWLAAIRTILGCSRSSQHS